MPLHVLPIIRWEFYIRIRKFYRHCGIFSAPIRISASLYSRPFPSLQMIFRPFSSLLQTQGLLPMYQFSFNLKHVFYHFCEEICWKRFLITIFPEQMLLSLWRILYLSIICNGSKMKNLSYTLQNMVWHAFCRMDYSKKSHPRFTILWLWNNVSVSFMK